jgi:YggT family protein
MGHFLEAIVGGLIELLIWVIIISAVMSWLIVFNVINDRNPMVRQVERFFWAVTRPVLWPLRRVIPPLGNVDITPIIAILILSAARTYLVPWVFGPLILLLRG